MTPGPLFFRGLEYSQTHYSAPFFLHSIFQGEYFLPNYLGKGITEQDNT